MAFAPKQSKANQIWLATFAIVILALAIEMQPQAKKAPNMEHQAAVSKEAQPGVSLER